MVAAKPAIGWGEKIGLGLLLVAVGLIMCRPGASSEPIPVGTPLPELMAEGWLNVTDASPPADAEGSPSQNSPSIPSRESLAGKVVVVDFWATWCVPCRVSLPKLSKLYATYQPLGVEFVGLTEEGETQRSLVEGVVESVKGFDWPVGYGSGPTFEMLGIQFLPTVVVFGKDGKAVWSGTSTWGLEAVLDEALAR